MNERHQLRLLQRKLEKWDKQLPNPHQRTADFNGGTGVAKGQHYAYRRVLQMIEVLLREDNEQRHYSGKLREMSAIQG